MTAPGSVDGTYEPATDPFTTPLASTTIGDAAPRTVVVVHGTVWNVEQTAWAGGDVLEATLVDPTGRLVLVFFGRSSVGGVEPGRRIAAAGRVGLHRGRRVLLNPQLWLLPTLDEGAPVTTIDDLDREVANLW